MISASTGNALQLDASWLAFAQADKLKHFGAYLVLAALWLYAFRQNGTRPTGRVALALFGLGAALEGVQWGFYPARVFEYGDMLANGLGATAGALGFRRLSRTLTPTNSLPHES